MLISFGLCLTTINITPIKRRYGDKRRKKETRREREREGRERETRRKRGKGEFEIAHRTSDSLAEPLRLERAVVIASPLNHEIMMGGDQDREPRSPFDATDRRRDARRQGEEKRESV
ncbi:hypothetical protein TIFTF001_009210 [Ficus carica]|uniref:Uncharacterized protein n=1 Tax=Ficus carica TaxID=3494 RepID=A0AA87ZTH5_FICCA|nr:hypothetical protein TIFTF001_009210 [Ficus carica]